MSLFLAVFCLLSIPCSAQCGHDQVFSLPITNVTLTNGADVRAIPLKVGVPAQTLAFMPQWPLNSTWVWDQEPQCKDTQSSAACTTFRGNIFNETSSTGFETAQTPVLNDTAYIPGGKYFTDTLQLTSNISLPKFGLGAPRSQFGGDYHSIHSLGLSANSTLLSALLDANRIASRTWSMYWGLDGATAPAMRDGSLVFGGYDKAKVAGPNYTAALSPINDLCKTGMVVSVSDISLSFPNGSQSSLLPPSIGGITSCIQPDWPVSMSLRGEYFEKFNNLTNTMPIGRSFGPNFYGMVYPPGTAYQGDLIIKLSSGFQSTIRNSQLVVPDQYIDKTSGKLVANSSADELLINALEDYNTDDMPKLGRPFLSGAYLMMSQDTNQFTLWAAKDNSTEELSPVGASCEANTGPPPPSGPSTNGNTAPGTLTGSDTGHGLSGGAIAGIVIGIVAVAAIIGVLLYMLRRQRQKSAAALAQQHAASDLQLKEAHITQTPQEMYVTPQMRAKAELPPGYEQSKFAQEMHEMPAAPPRPVEMPAQSRDRLI